MSLDALIGEWEAEFTVLGETARGRMSCDGELGGAFLLQRLSAEHPDAPFSGRFEDGGDTIRGTWEWKRDGSWEKDFDLVYRRT